MTGQVTVLWENHRQADWPSDLGSYEGELMMIDTVISGCATYYTESGEGLDPQRVTILEDCLSDLENLLPDLGDPALPYFSRLQTLGNLMLERES